MAKKLIVFATAVLAVPQAKPATPQIPPAGNGANGEMGGIFGMGVGLPYPKTMEALAPILMGMMSSSSSPKSAAPPKAAPTPKAAAPKSSGIPSGIAGLLGPLFGATPPTSSSSGMTGLLAGMFGAKGTSTPAPSSSSSGGMDITAIVPTGPEYPKSKMTLKEFYDPGSGPYPSHFLADPTLPHHTVYAPKVKPPASVKMPVAIWSNGGCFAGGTPYAPFLNEVASYGYLVLAIGVPGAGNPNMEGDMTLRGPNNDTTYKAEDMIKRPFAYVQDILDAQKWVEDGKADKYGNIDKDSFITFGSSCGGLMSYSGAYHNPKVKLVGVMNSGVIDPKKKYLLQELNTTVAIVNGGPLDIAYVNVSSIAPIVEQWRRD